MNRWLLKGVMIGILTIKAGLCPALAASSEAITALSLDDYVHNAVDVGVQGKENALALESAGYFREIAFRQTEAPTASVAYTRGRAETVTNGSISTLTEVRNTALTVNETTPLGTTLAATGGYGDTYGTAGGIPLAASGELPNASITGSQPIYLFVKNPTARLRRRADLAFADAKNTFASTVLNIRTQARALYYAVMQSEEGIDVAQRKTDSSRKLLEITQALVDAGKTAAVETARAQITLADDLRALNNAVVTRDQAALTAKNYIAMPLDRNVSFTSKLSYKPFAVPLEKLVDYAILHQPELQILRDAQETALLNLQQARETTRPTLALNGAYNYGETPADLSLVSYAHGWNWSLNANWLFFDSGVTRDQVRAARIAQTVADLNLENAERTTQLNIRNAYMDVKRTEQQIIDFQSSQDQARRNVDVLRLRFQHGLNTLLDVLDAEVDERNLDTEYLGLLVQFNESKDQLSEQVGVDMDTL